MGQIWNAQKRWLPIYSLFNTATLPAIRQSADGERLTVSQAVCPRALSLFGKLNWKNSFRANCEKMSGKEWCERENMLVLCQVNVLSEFNGQICRAMKCSMHYWWPLGRKYGKPLSMTWNTSAFIAVTQTHLYTQARISWNVSVSPSLLTTSKSK